MLVLADTPQSRPYRNSDLDGEITADLKIK